MYIGIKYMDVSEKCWLMGQVFMIHHKLDFVTLLLKPLLKN